MSTPTSGLTALASPATGDLLKLVDISDTSGSANGTDKKVTLASLIAFLTSSLSFQPVDSDLTAIAALTTTTFGRGFLVLADAAAGRTALSLGTMATQGAGAVAITGGSISGVVELLTLNPQASSYTLVLADAGKYVQMGSGSAQDLTVPANSSVAFAIGTQIVIRNTGAGQTTVVAGGGVTVNTSQTLNLRVQHSTATLVKVGTDEWDLAGDLEAV